MQIPCPFCGPRDLREFTYMGDASRTVPALDDDFDTWADFVWTRKNPRGQHREHWQHTHGCRQFLQLERDTQTHEISEVTAIGPQGKGTAQ